MLMIDVQGFFDETGHGNDPQTQFLGIVGCLGKAGVWIESGYKWADTLEKHKVLPDADGKIAFHMTDFAHSAGVFKGWKEEQRKALYGDLWMLIDEVKPYLCGCFVPMPEYRDILSSEAKEQIHDAYYVCYLKCLIFACQISVNEKSPDNQISAIFDDKPGYMGFARELYEDIRNRFDLKGRIPVPVFQDDRDHPGLQVADIVAYEAKCEFTRRKYQPEKVARYGFGCIENLIRDTHGNKVRFGEAVSGLMLLSESDLQVTADVLGKKFACSNL